MQWQSKRSKRVVRSALAAEAAALATGQDMSILLRALIARVLGIGDPKNSWRDKLRAIPPVDLEGLPILARHAPHGRSYADRAARGAGYL